MFEAAQRLGAKVVVFLNHDHWIKFKKGLVFMLQEERAEGLRVSRREDISESAVCTDLKIQMLFDVGGAQVRSNSALTRKSKASPGSSCMPKGILLAGGKGTRLAPATRITNKHLLPILNKPIILYPIETLKAFGIRDMLLVSGREHLGSFAEFLGDGSEYGVNLTYRVQNEAGGIAEALGLGKDFAQGQPVLVILGDNIFDNRHFSNPTPFPANDAVLFMTKVPDPQCFGVVKLDAHGEVESIIEKPTAPPSDMAVTGLYYYPYDVFEVVNGLVPSSRGELEITDVNNYYVQQSRCRWRVLTQFWSDAGTPDSLFRICSWAMSHI